MEAGGGVMHTDNSSMRRIWAGLLAFLAIIVLATVLYAIAGHSILDALYMVIVTVFAVGYHEIIPSTSPALRMLTMMLIIGGTTATVYIVSATVRFMTQGDIERLLGARRMMHDIEAMSNHVIICGFGRMGQILARDLASENKPFVVLDNDSAVVKDASECDYLVLEGDATDEDLLKRAGLEAASYIACTLPSDSDNVFIALSARNLNPEITIIARGEAPSTEGKLRQAGADHIILPPAIGGSRIAELILTAMRSKSAEPEQVAILGEGGQAEAGLAVCSLHVDESGETLESLLAACRKKTRVPFAVIGFREEDGSLSLELDTARVTLEGEEVLLACKSSDAPALRREITRPTPE